MGQKKSLVKTGLNLGPFVAALFLRYEQIKWHICSESISSHSGTWVVGAHIDEKFAIREEGDDNGGGAVVERAASCIIEGCAGAGRAHCVMLICLIPTNTSPVFVSLLQPLVSIIMQSW